MSRKEAYPALAAQKRTPATVSMAAQPFILTIDTAAGVCYIKSAWGYYFAHHFNIVIATPFAKLPRVHSYIFCPGTDRESLPPFPI